MPEPLMRSFEVETVQESYTYKVTLDAHRFEAADNTLAFIIEYDSGFLYCVRMFAPGTWKTVEEVTDKGEVEKFVAQRKAERENEKCNCPVCREARGEDYPFNAPENPEDWTH